MRIAQRLLLSLAMATLSLPCAAQRYLADVFPEVMPTYDIVYGMAAGTDGTVDTLRLDLYEPAGDTETFRPLLVLIHGGSFTGGRRTDESIVSIARTFVRKGYVAASISYRLSDTRVLNWDTFEIDTLALFGAAHIAMHDAKAAVRFFRATAGKYRLDVRHIAIGGLSAGGIIAVTAAYTDRIEELVPGADPAVVEGASGHAEYSSAVSTVVSLCGAAIDVSILDTSSSPRLFLAHDRGDPAVPFRAAEALYSQALAMGVPAKAEFFSWPWHCSFGDAQGNDPFGTRSVTIGSLTRFLADPLIAVSSESNIFPERGIELEVYPNPARSWARFVVTGGGSGLLEIRDVLGRAVRTLPVGNDGQVVLHRDGLSAGSYLGVFKCTDGGISTRLLVLR